MTTNPAVATVATARPALAGPLVVLVLALLLGIQPVTTDLYLPALPALRDAFDVPMTAAQMTLSVLLVCFGVSQLLCGPLADRYGRRPVLLGGLGLYVAGAVLSAWAPAIEVLVAARGLQGVGMAASVVCGRAMVRDLYEPHEGTHVMSKALSGLGLIAISSPIAGGTVAGALGRRAALLVTALFGAATLAVIALRVPETARQLNPSATRPGPLVATFARLIRHPTFFTWTVLTTSAYAGLLAFLGGSSFTYMKSFGLSRPIYGLVVASSAMAYFAGTVICRRWLARHGIRGTIRRGGFVTLAAALLFALPTLADAHTVWSLTAAQWGYGLGHGIHQPCGQAGVVGPFPREAGAASALSGFFLSMGAFAMGGWLGIAIDGRVAPFAWTIAALALSTATVAFTLVQRHGDPLARP
jgi:DHA1 family bicyclomycin/chloramphenicol resistance-like MFS transporter